MAQIILRTRRQRLPRTASFVQDRIAPSSLGALVEWTKSAYAACIPSSGAQRSGCYDHERAEVCARAPIRLDMASYGTRLTAEVKKTVTLSMMIPKCLL